jgi:YesN/AraC family two-component response regulator
VDGYNDPRQALAGFRKQQYDLVILDIKMPHLNGFELSREISKVDEDAKIGFMSAFDVNLNEAKAVFPTLKVLFFIRKPVSLTRLAEQISAFVS